MEHLEILERKELRKKIKDILKEGFLPGVLYGPDVDATNIKVSEKEFLKVFKKTGESELFKVSLNKKEYLVLVKDIQRDIISDRIIHIDFYQPKLGQKMELTVPLKFIGEAPAERKGGIVVKVMHEIEIECLPRQIPKEIEVDLSSLEGIDSVIKVKDLNFNEGVKPLASEDNIIVSIAEPEKEEVIEETKAKSESEEKESLQENKEETKG